MVVDVQVVAAAEVEDTVAAEEAVATSAAGRRACRVLAAVARRLADPVVVGSHSVDCQRRGLVAAAVLPTAVRPTPRFWIC